MIAWSSIMDGYLVSSEWLWDTVRPI